MTDHFYHHRRAQTCIAGHYLNSSKHPDSFVGGIYPTHIAKGRGCYLWDHKGKKYLDFMAGQGASILGYAHPRVNEAMRKAMEAGATHSLATHYELDAAEKLKELVPFIDCVRWCKSAFDAKALVNKINIAGDLFVRDESITGFRYPKYTLSGYNGSVPDIIVLGGTIANGMPLTAVAGKYHIMNAYPYGDGTIHSGEILSLAAALETMTLLQTTYQLDWLWANGQKFLDEFNSYSDKLKLVGQPTHAEFVGDSMTKALFWQEACKAGMLFGQQWYYSFPAIEEARNAMGSIKTILQRVDRGDVKLEGDMPCSEFANKVREREY